MNVSSGSANIKPISAVTRPADPVKLSPAQISACVKVERLLGVSAIVALSGSAGSGRTTILEALAQKYGGKIISMRDVVTQTVARDAKESEAAIGAYIVRTLDSADLVFVDDFTALGFSTHVARGTYFSRIVLKHVYSSVIKSGKRLVVAGGTWEAWQSPADVYGSEASIVVIPGFSPADYATVGQNVLGRDEVAGIDFQLVYRFASLLNGHQLRMTCELLANEKPISADIFINCLQRYIVSANTRTDEVEALSFDSLAGAEDIISRLETHIVLPLENRLLAQRLGLKPKRGVLLYGPAGTGKTSIGRALAHRMRGRFFLIDGAFVSEPPQSFFMKLEKVVQEAKENSPSVLFIDDADMLFTIEHIAGLSRYLLTLLDGLESETSSNICVMMTAMNVRLVPEALLRSGRVELWLETKLPSEETRGKILRRWMGTDIPGHELIDYIGVARVTDGFTPADLRRIAGDAKALYASDRVKKRPVRTAMNYVTLAVETIVAVRGRMADTLGDEGLRVGEGRTQSKYAKGYGGAAQAGTCVTPGW